MRTSLGLIVLSIAMFASSAAVAAQSGSSGGIGLTLDEWEEIFGPQQSGQSLVYFTTEGGYDLYVGVDDREDRVTSIQFDLSQGEAGSLAFDDAQELVERLLPDDIDLAETFETPSISPGYPNIYAHVWESDWLDDELNDRQQVLVVYSEEGGSLPGSDGLDLVISRVYISVESE